jgi:hypothetical protein
MPSAGFEPAIPSLKWPQIYALGKVYNGARTDTTQQSDQSPDNQVKTSHFVVHVSGYPSGGLSSNNWLLPGLTKYVCLEPTAQSGTCSSQHRICVSAVDKTYLLESVTHVACMGSKRQTVSQQGSQAEALGCTTGEITL